MSDQSKDETLHQLVIVRRRKGGGEEGHHGGVWKIAYADFMTAMMAFFLVMWLVNMTDDKTVAQIANYFNAIQLTDRAPSKKGLEDANPKSITPRMEKKAPSGEGPDDAKPVPRQPAPASPGQARNEKARKTKAAVAEAALFVDPGETIEEVAKAAEAGGASSVSTSQGDGPHQAHFGPDFSDPFDPFQSGQSRVAPATNGSQKSAKEMPSAESGGQGKHEKGESSGVAKYAEAAPASESPSEMSVKLAGSIRNGLQHALMDLSLAAPDVSVTATKDGILISVMDGEKAGMFEIASAKPLPVAVQVVERIGAVIKGTTGGIVVRGHTDGRAYRNASYDNWRLSTARAHMAHYMLLKAGIDKTRIERIEGVAEREPIMADDPLAAQNRRIEFLIRVSSK